MKLMTMNVHSLSGVEDERKMRCLADFLLREHLDALALQEVSQSREAPILSEPPQGWILPRREIPLRQDNFLLGLSERLKHQYVVSWLPVKLGYGTLDEGVAILSRIPLCEVEEILLTPNRPYEDWRRRSALSVRTVDGERLVSLHMSWWEEGFLSEWEALSDRLGSGAAWLMGDFNVSAERLCKEGDPLLRAGFHDSYALAGEKDAEDTVLPHADGWWGRERTDGLRIDQIRCRPSRKILRYRRVLDGRSESMISDHFGVMIETGENDHNRE